MGNLVDNLINGRMNEARNNPFQTDETVKYFRELKNKIVDHFRSPTAAPGDNFRFNHLKCSFYS